MLRTALASVLLVLCGWAAAAWLTLDFQAWTDEGARRLVVALHPVAVPAVAVDGPGVAARSLPEVLAEGDRVTIVDFFYTRCQTVCLSLGSGFQQLQATLQAQATAGHPPKVRLLSISFDGTHDTPSVLQSYASNLQADPAWWRFVRVTDATAQQTLLRRLGVVVVPNALGDFEHNAALLVFDRHGRMLRVFDLADQALALNYASHLGESTP